LKSQGQIDIWSVSDAIKEHRSKPLHRS